MCKVYNTVRCLTTIRTHLTKNNIHDFNSLHQLISFQNNYATSRQQIISNETTLVTQEKSMLSSAVSELENEISKDKIDHQQKLKFEIAELRRQYNAISESHKSVIQEFTQSFKALFIAIKFKYKELFFDLIISSSLRPKAKILATKRNRFQYISSHFEEVVNENSRRSLNDHDRKKRAIDEINTFIYGAIGEQKAVKELEQLSDEYILINDFSVSFPKPINYPQGKQYVRSIQIDHLLISRSGIFLIETKNWSKGSLQNLSLRSPVDQIKRTQFALSEILSGNSHLNLAKHHWGDRKIPIKNLIVLIKHKPTEEFQYVKVLTLNQLVGYVQYFQPSMSKNETEEIANYLINISNRN